MFLKVLMLVRTPGVAVVVDGRVVVGRIDVTVHRVVLAGLRSMWDGGFGGSVH